MRDHRRYKSYPSRRGGKRHCVKEEFNLRKILKEKRGTMINTSKGGVLNVVHPEGKKKIGGVNTITTSR